MQTTNLISTPQITGNIGSCATEVVTVTAGRPNIFIETYTDIATNSCTGTMTQYNYWGLTFTGFIFSMVICTVVILLAITLKIFAEERKN